MWRRTLSQRTLCVSVIRAVVRCLRTSVTSVLLSICHTSLRSTSFPLFVIVHWSKQFLGGFSSGKCLTTRYKISPRHSLCVAYRVHSTYADVSLYIVNRGFLVERNPYLNCWNQRNTYSVSKKLIKMLPVKDGTSEFWRNLFVRCHRFLCSPCSLLERALPGWKAKEQRVYTDSKVPQVELTNLTTMHRRHIFKCKLKIFLLITQSWHFTVWLKYSLTVAVFIHKFALLCFTRCSTYT